MSDLIKIIAVILFIALIPKLIILAGLYIAAAYGIFCVYAIFSNCFDDTRGNGGHNSSSDRDRWSGTGNPHV